MKRAVILFMLFASAVWGANADLVLRNGMVITMDSANPKATALAIQKDKIVWVGEDAQAQSWIGAATKVIDLKGAFVYPGFIDSHAHILALGGSRLEIDLNDTPNKETIAKMVQERISKAKKGDWILGRGWDQNQWPEKKFPTAQDLDPVSPENPVVLERTDGHAVWANSVALRLAGVTAATKDPQGGKIIHDEKGNPTGVLVDNAMDLVNSKMKSLSQTEEIERTTIALKEAAS
ncbi:MAG: amidohydrolase, partial [Acidobacteria bacterium]